MPSFDSRDWLGSRLKKLSFACRASGLRMIRRMRNLTDRVRRPSAMNRVTPDEIANAWPFVAGESITPLWSKSAETEWALVAGKVQNLRVAVAHCNGTTIAAGGVFSFGAWWANQPNRVVLSQVVNCAKAA